MPLLGHGIDLVHLPRIQATWTRHGECFLKRVLTPREQRLFRSRPDPLLFLAGRFAAKEAVFKALGLGFLQVGPAVKSVEILPICKRGPLHVELQGPLSAWAEKRSDGAQTTWELSISHSGSYAMASAIWWHPTTANP